MMDTQVTVVGNVVTDPKLTMTKDKQPFTTFRIASTPRRFDRGTGEWRDGDTNFLSVICWRGLAENTATCVKKGQAVIVVGRLLIRQFETKDGEKRQTTEIDAAAIGPDLGRVVAIIRRAERSIPSVSDGAKLENASEVLAEHVAGLLSSGEELGGEGPIDVEGLDWRYAGLALDAGEEAGETEAAPAVPTEPMDDPVTPAEPDVPVLVGAGGRSKGRSH
jgi:single-strand DNA-binding protein